MENQKKKSNHFHLEPVLTRAFLKNLRTIIIVTNRSIGKTTSSLKYFRDKALETGKQFIYVRRFERDVEKWKTKMKKDGKKYGITTVGDFIYYVLGEKPVIIGEVVALHTWDGNASGEYDDYFGFYFDEFISQSGRYIKNEFDVLIGAFITFNRNNKEFFGVLSGNRVNANNPYHNTIGLDRTTEHQELEEYGVYCYQPPKDKYQIFEQEDTASYRLAKASEGVFNASYGGEFLYDNFDNIVNRKQIPIRCKRAHSYRIGDIYCVEGIDRETGNHYMIKLQISELSELKKITYALALVDSIDGKAINSELTKQDYKDFAERFYNLWKNQKLFFTDFDLKDNLKIFIVRNYAID